MTDLCSMSSGVEGLAHNAHALTHTPEMFTKTATAYKNTC